MNSAIIFGGASGIGDMIREHLSALGYFCTISGRRHLEKENYICADVTSESDVTNVFKNHQDSCGAPPDIVINASAVQGPINKTWELDVNQWKETIDIDLNGAFIVTKVSILQFQNSGKGKIVLFSGGGAAYSRPNFCAYGVAKTAVLRLVETVDHELKESGIEYIKICAMAPGAVKTKMTEEILASGNDAGKKAIQEAESVMENGGTSAMLISNLIDFILDENTSQHISGRMIHVKEPYQTVLKNCEDDELGKLRRISL